MPKWTVKLQNGESEEVRAESCELTELALVFRKKPNMVDNSGTIVRAFVNRIWQEVVLEEEEKKSD